MSSFHDEMLKSCAAAQAAAQAAAKPRTIEELLSASPAPRVTEERIASVIKGEQCTRLTDVLTVCVVTLKNGFTVTGESACVSLANYNKELGEHYAREDAKRKIWTLEAYLLKEQAYQTAQIDKSLHGLFAGIFGQAEADDIQARVFAKRAAEPTKGADAPVEGAVSKEYDAAMTDAKGACAPGPDPTAGSAGCLVSATDNGYDERYRRDQALHMAITHANGTSLYIDPDMVVDTAHKFYTFTRGDAK